MRNEIVEISDIDVVGIATHTSNMLEATPQGRIVSLHEAFITKHISDVIASKKDNRMLAIYTDYEDEESGEYLYAIGHHVLDSTDIPEGCEHFHIPKGKYLLYPTERGFINEVLPLAWQNIWRLTQEGGLGGIRTYKTDFEFHNYDDPLSPDVQIDIYIGVE